MKTLRSQKLNSKPLEDKGGLNNQRFMLQVCWEVTIDQARSYSAAGIVT